MEMIKIDYSKFREKYVNWVKTQLIGPPFYQDDSLYGIPPLDRYTTGILFPVVKGGEGIDPGYEANSLFSEEDDEAEEEEKGAAKPSEKRYRYMPPSSVGFSFFVHGEQISFQIQYSAVRYEREKKQGENGRYVTRSWNRIPLAEKEGNILNFDLNAIVLSQTENGNLPIKEALKFRQAVLEDNAVIDILGRPYADGWLVTVTLCNSALVSTDGTAEEWIDAKNQSSLFETSLSCSLGKGEVGTYPRVDPQLLSAEEQELELQYRHHHIYAIGHGGAVDWTLKEKRVNKIRTEFIPSVEVPHVTADVSESDGSILCLEALACCRKNLKSVTRRLSLFADQYGKWIEAREQEIAGFPSKEKDAAQRIVLRMDKALKRMKTGVAMIANDSCIAQAFEIANQAMLSQMMQHDKVLRNEKGADAYKWRPFQLAFILTALESAVNEDSLDRDRVDLIWFPTGGGKTEAYLGLVAFFIAWRRLTNPTSGGGTCVLMRYTLRLLTSQQYQRATRLVCALELIRQSHPELGKEPITIGMWVGQATSPNTCKQAHELIVKASRGKGEPPGKLVLDGCPWCRKPFKAPDNFHASPLKFNFFCTNPACDFVGDESGIIPCQVVDEALYAEPPTFLIATIDKFARLAWEERTNAFFGKGVNRPPELVIQDELHLISGALGSIAGLYEAALDTVLIHLGIRPKYIASTATIRMAEEQVKRLYGKSVSVFPPPGLDCDDSYFARTIPLDVRPGRLYLGYLAPALSRQQCMAPLASTLMAAPEALFGKGHIDQDALLEAWWTLTVYHGSLKGVGNSHNLFNVDIPRHFKRLKDEATALGFRIDRTPKQISQLTSVSTAQENAETFARLERKRTDELCLDAALATNMISVGLDVARLALMIVNGQPLTTAEYIQASSRVGRSQVPGIVFTNFYRDQARSLSHYENFKPFHESFYRFVEPTSITPYTFQSRRRALHAALVIAVRHGCPSLLKNNCAQAFDPENPAICKIIETLKLRCSFADKERANEIKRHIDRLAQEWQSEAAHCRSVKRQLDYCAPQNINNTNRLLHAHGDKIKGLWPTLNSMRNVEHTALLKPL